MRVSWESEIDELRRREAYAEELGGPDKVDRQHHFGKLTIRERIDLVADSGSFHEIARPPVSVSMTNRESFSS